MSLIAPYPHEDRAKARAIIKRLFDLRVHREAMALGKIPENPKLIAAVAALTDTVDVTEQLRVIGAMHEARVSGHRNALIERARDDLTAYAEVISPNEPPPRHLIYISERLMEVERGERDRLALSMPPGHAKDLDVDTPVMMGDGSLKRLGDIRVGDMVITMAGRAREVIAVHDQGVRPVMKIRTKSGRITRPHPEHVYLTARDWVEAKDLMVGDDLVLPRAITTEGSIKAPREDFAFAGYMMARAIVSGRSYNRLPRVTRQFRADDPHVLNHMSDIARRMGFAITKQSRKLFYKRMTTTLTFDNAAKIWLSKNGLWQVHKDEIRVPAWIMGGTEMEIAAFLGAIMSCDAYAKPTVNQHTGAPRKLALRIRNNEALAGDLQHLFLRCGINVSLRRAAWSNYNYRAIDFTYVEINDTLNQGLVGRRLPIRGATRAFWELPVAGTKLAHESLFADEIVEILPDDGQCETRCLTVEEDHSFLANGLIVHNSTYSSRLYPSWYLGRAENRIYLQAGHSKPFAVSEFGTRTRDICASEDFQACFPGITVRPDRRGANDWMLTNGNRYVCKGIGEGISGFRSTCNGVDDPYADFAAAQSPTKRKKIWDWFANDFMTRLLPYGAAFVVATRWHVDDIIGRIEQMIGAGELTEPWEILNLSVFGNGDPDQPYFRQNFEPLWPEFYTKEFLLRKKEIMTSQSWACLYEGTPLPADGNIIKADWLTNRWVTYPNIKGAAPTSKEQTPAAPMKRVAPPTRDAKKHDVAHAAATEALGTPTDSSPAGVKSADSEIQHAIEAAQKLGQILNPPTETKIGDRTVTILGGLRDGGGLMPYRRCVMSIDSAETETERADYTAMTIWRESADGWYHYLVFGHRERMEFPKLIERTHELAERFEVDTILVETKGAGNQLVQHYTALEGSDDHPGFEVIGLSPGKDGKVFRMDSVTPILRQGRMVLPVKAEWLVALETELLQFPGSKNDDFADTVSMYLKWARDNAPVKFGGTRKLGGGRAGAGGRRSKVIREIERLSQEAEAKHAAKRAGEAA